MCKCLGIPTFAPLGGRSGLLFCWGTLVVGVVKGGCLLWGMDVLQWCEDK